jgi:hypothetical protein
MHTITDFLELSNDDEQPPDKLRRCDLGILRLHVRIMPRTLEYPGDHLPMMQASITRLLAAGLLDEYWEGAPATYITDFGRDVVRANSSCIDGSECMPVAPGRVRDFWEQLFPPQTQLLLAAPIERTPTKAEYESALAIAMSETLPPPATDHESLADVGEVQAGCVGVGAAVWAWVRRQLAFGRLCLAVAIGCKHLGGHE